MIQIAIGQAVGPYQAQGFLGRGAFAQIFLAEDRHGRPCALKVGDEKGGGRYVPRFKEITEERSGAWISPDETPAEAYFLDPRQGAQAEVLNADEVDQLLLQEARMLEAADGQGVVPLREVLDAGGRPVLVLDFIAGRSLRERMRSLEGVKLGWLLDAIRTIDELSARGLWTHHGDLKPENILVTGNEQVLLIDPSAHDAREDMMLATPFYNPFLLRDGKADIHGLAIMIYELLCGAIPFESVPWEYAGVSPELVDREDYGFSRSFMLSYPRPKDLNPHSPAELERLVYRALCDESYGMTELRFDLEDFLLRR